MTNFSPGFTLQGADSAGRILHNPPNYGMYPQQVPVVPFPTDLQAASHEMQAIEEEEEQECSF